MESHTSRRKFLAHTSIAAATLTILRDPSSAWSFQANDKLNIALVGCGGRGSWFVDCVPRMGQNLVAMCDVNQHKAKDFFAACPEAKKFDDFRKMLSEMDKHIDAVIVATPDHTHAVIAMTAMRMGKHVYVEKPLTGCLWEARMLREAANQHKVATQMGNQGTASEAFRKSVDLIQSGALGEVKEVHAWNSAGGRNHQKKPAETPPVPPYLNWDLWLGPAADRAYHPFWMSWGGWRDMGTSTAGNWAIHSMNLAFKALRLETHWNADSTAKVKIEARTSNLNRLSFPEWEIVKYDFPARGDMPPVRINWYNGKSAPAAESRDIIENLQGSKLDWGDAGEKRWKDHGGCIMVGSEGLLRLTEHNSSCWLLPEDKFRDFTWPQRKTPRSPGHELEWFNACKGNAPAMSDFNYADPMTEFVLLSNVATQFERPLEFAPAAFRFTDNATADQCLGREYRKGWSL